MSVLLETISSFMVFLTPNFGSKGRGTDRRLMSENRARCGIRAFDGRVLNIGTEWSIGACEITSGHLRFVPSMGIVGNREIEVIDVRAMEGGPYERVVVPWGESADLIISTAKGELYVIVPEHIAEQFMARLTSPAA